MPRYFLLIASLALLHVNLHAQLLPIGTILPTRQTPVHDPAMIEENGTYYLFCTGMGISVWSSVDFRQWKKEAPVFDQPPAWAVAAVPGYNGHTWAPDIQYHDGHYYLYYSVSTFGKNSSCIGVAINKTLDPASPDFRWEDQGKVIQSVPGRDLWNAIDPNCCFDEKGTGWLVFGSFWNGIKLVCLNDSLLAPAKPEEWYSIASRKRSAGLADSLPGDAAIEAPFIFKNDGFYYLFVSFDYCCRAENSTYKVVVGRSASIRGPYLDQTGKAMLDGGGTLVVEGNKEWHGTGHSATVRFNGKDYLIFHGYDANDQGRSKLRIEPVHWVNGWPELRNE